MFFSRVPKPRWWMGACHGGPWWPNRPRAAAGEGEGATVKWVRLARITVELQNSKARIFLAPKITKIEKEHDTAIKIIL